MMKFNSIHKMILICAASVLLNIAGTIVVRELELPIYFDTYGTIFIAALGGYVPGIAVGFFTNFIDSLFYENEMYFGFVSILVAILTAFFQQRGYYEKLSKVLITIPFTALLTSLFSLIIEEFIYSSEPFKSSSQVWLHYCDNLSVEIPDKALAILFAFFLLKVISSDLKEKILMLGRMQAPISSDMRRKLSKESKFIRSLRTKMVFNLIAITLLIACSISAISYTIHQRSEIEERKRIADGIISMVVSEIDPKRVDEFLEKGYQAKGYIEVERELRKIRASNSDIRFLYVYKIMEDGCHVIFDLDTATIEASEPGSIEEFDESFQPLLPDLFAGRPIPPIINNDKFGYLLTIYKPVYDSVGRCVCYAGIDFSMDQITDYGRMFISKVIAMFAGILIFIFVVALAFIENNIIIPVNTMAHCARNFAYDSEEDREKNIERIKSLEIKTNDEIENLYSAFVKTTEDSMHNFENLRRAKIEVAVMDELAHKDALTGMKNKTSYSEMTSKLDQRILAGSAEFCIIMIDINFLKRVNDTYGHERGDEYLINAGKLVRDVFGKENVYRIGGDEFVAIFDGDKVSRCEESVANIRARIEKFRADKSLEPWQKVSAAVGVAYYRAGVDKTADEVFKRADSDMYKNKLAMKATRKE